MNGFTCIIAWGIILGLVITICCLYLRFRRIRKNYSRNMVINIREQDRIARELEQARIEKEAIQKVLETHLVAADKVMDKVTENTTEKITANTTDKIPIVHIDITYDMAGEHPIPDNAPCQP